MAEELQSLLEKINQQGIQKAEQKKAEIISQAHSEAEKIINDAEMQAKKTVADAESNAARIYQQSADKLAQIKRDIILQLRDDLNARLNNTVKNAAAAAFSPEFMAQLISDLAKTFAAAPEQNISVRCAAKDVDALNNALQASLADSLAKNAKLFAGKGIAGGIEVSFDGGNCFYDFTVDAITDLMNEYTGDFTANAFRDEK